MSNAPLTQHVFEDAEPQPAEPVQTKQPQQTQDSQKPKKSPTAFRTISEVADGLGVQQHVLRFWETKFSQVRPLKRGGGRRYYRPEDVALLQRIHHLLYTEGYTIKGVQKLLKGQGKAQILADEPPQNQNVKTQATSGNQSQKGSLSDGQRSALEAMLGELKDLRNLIKPE